MLFCTRSPIQNSKKIVNIKTITKRKKQKINRKKTGVCWSQGVGPFFVQKCVLRKFVSLCFLRISSEWTIILTPLKVSAEVQYQSAAALGTSRREGELLGRSHQTVITQSLVDTLGHTVITGWSSAPSSSH